MAYVATLSNSQQIAIALQGMQTKVTLTSSSPGQQQSQSSSFNTGKWRTTPKLLNVGQGAVLQVDSDRGSHYIHILSSSINLVDPPSDLQNYTAINLKEVDDATAANSKPIEPMPSMQPMQMGNMSMDINSMTMKMGDMSMGINNPAKTTTAKQFCSQCGTEVKAGDRFCRSCGHELSK